MQLTYYGQSSFLVEVNNKKILFDPFIDTEKAQADFKTAGKTLLLPKIGETIEV